MGIFSSDEKKRKKEQRALRKNRARHEFWGMDFAPWADDRDPDKWMEEYEMMDMVLDDDDDEDDW